MEGLDCWCFGAICVRRCDSRGREGIGRSRGWRKGGDVLREVLAAEGSLKGEFGGEGFLARFRTGFGRGAGRFRGRFNRSGGEGGGRHVCS